MKTVPLHGKKAAGRVALVDDEDYKLVSCYRWHIYQRERAVYATANIRRPDGRRTMIKMHNLIMGCVGIDHRNGNGLDNQRVNLRSATHPQNMHNMRSYAISSSPFKGVSWDSHRQKWHAKISNRHLGRFASEEEAARAYDAAALAAWGEYARLNFEEST